jgi:hypothetical protein
MAVHTKEQREFIVRRLAAFETPRDIAVAFAARFKDTACGEDDVLAVDPRIAIVDPDLHTLFRIEREKILDDPNAAPMAEQRARLIVLSRQAERYENNNQPAEARAVLRQIAEETGAVAGKGGAKAAALSSAMGVEEVVAITRTVVDPKVPA